MEDGRDDRGKNLSKRYGEKAAVDGLDFVVQPGIVTGFLGPNGAGKPVTEL
jgi:ABC-2 type transport system ATP-binding protein